jgi:hypothetical protein
MTIRALEMCKGAVCKTVTALPVRAKLDQGCLSGTARGEMGLRLGVGARGTVWGGLSVGLVQ